MGSNPPYRLGGLLGEGTSGEVRSALHLPSGSRVAVKLLRADLGRQARLFRAEVEAIARVDHPGIHRVYDHGVFDGRPFLAMELADGSLGDVGAGPTSYDALTPMVRQLLAALAHAHARGLVHRDLKAANVLVVRGRLHLADFGLAWLGARPGALHGGTPTMMAPEQHRSDARWYGPWTDLYGLGAMLWRLVTGAAPFVGDAETLSFQHLHAPLPPLRPRFPVAAGLEAWLSHLLEKQPLARPASAAAALRAFEALDRRWVDASPREPHPSSAPRAEPPRSSATRPEPRRSSKASTYFDDEDADSHTLAPFFGSTGPTRSVQPMPSELADVPWAMTPLLVGAGQGLLALRDPPLFGRVDERDRLWAALREVVDTGRVVVVALRGEPGSGRRRLMQWVTCRARELDVAEAVMLDELPPDPWSALAEGAFSWGPPEAAYLAGPLVLGIDATQGWPAGALRLLAEREARPFPALLVVRTGFEPAPPGVRVLDVDPLEVTEALRLAISGLGLCHDLAQRVVAQVGCRPGALVDWVRGRCLTQELVDSPAGFALVEGATLHSASDERRWARWLAASDRVLLGIGALIGERPSEEEWRDLAAACGVGFDATVLVEAEKFGLLGRTADGWSFPRAEVVEALVQTLPAPLAAAAHAERIKRLDGRAGSAYRRAKHLAAIGSLELAIEAFIDATSNATVSPVALLGVADALGATLRAAGVPRGDARWAAALKAKLAAQGNLDPRLLDRADLAEVAAHRDDVRWRPACRVALQCALALGDPELAASYLPAVEASGATSSSDAGCVARLAQARGDFVGMLRWAEHALAIADPRDRAATAAATNNLASMYLVAQRRDEALVLLERCLALAEHHDIGEPDIVHLNVAGLHLAAKNYPAAAHHAALAEALAGRTGALYSLLYAATLSAMIAAASGDLEAFDEHVDRAIRYKPLARVTFDTFSEGLAAQVDALRAAGHLERAVRLEELWPIREGGETADRDGVI